VEDEGTDTVSPIDDVEEYFYRNELMMIKSNNDLPTESSSSSSSSSPSSSSPSSLSLLFIS